MDPAILAALVLGGGGPVGAAWMSGFLRGVISEGIPVGESAVVLGTSAGAVVGSWLTMQPDGLPTVTAHMRTRAVWHAANSRAGRTDTSFIQRTVGSVRGGDSGANADATTTTALRPMSVQEAEAMWREKLPKGPWAANLAITAVDSTTGRVRIWSAADGLSLPAAVACSTAAPGIAPPVAVDGTLWLDGGVRSGLNADLILELPVDHSGDDGHRRSGPGKVLVLAPMPGSIAEREEAILVEHGYAVRVVTADSIYTSPADLLDAGFIDSAAAIGIRQAHALSAELFSWLDI